MGIISEVKCGRCDRRYSGFRSRCPYCGARRNKRGKHADESDNSRGKLIIGILLLLILIVAIVVLIVTSLGEKKAADKDDSKKENIVDVNDDDVTSVPGTEPTVKPTEQETNVPTGNDKQPTENEPKVEVESVTLMYAGRELDELDFTIGVGETLQLEYETEPAETGLKPKWASSDENVFIVKSTGEVMGVGEGDETLTLTVGDKTVECIVRVH